MEKLISFIISILGLSGLATVTEFVNFRPEISTQMTKVILTNADNPIVVPIPNNNDCPCDKRTGIITHGDGHTSRCPCENGECGCSNKEEQPVEESPEPTTPQIPLIPVIPAITTDPIVPPMAPPSTAANDNCATGNCQTNTSTSTTQSTTQYYTRPRILGRIFRR